MTYHRLGMVQKDVRILDLQHPQPIFMTYCVHVGGEGIERLFSGTSIHIHNWGVSL